MRNLLPPKRRRRHAHDNSNVALFAIIVVVLVIILGIGHHWRVFGQSATATFVGRAHVIDGDTITIGDVHIRLQGIDAPESDQTCTDKDGASYRCGLLATAVLEEEIAGRAVTCFAIDTDRYGRTIASCEVNGRDLGDAMVRRGFAVAYRRYSTKYEAAEVEAKEARRGIWAGGFEMPEQWRHRK
jgi:endonuclease YncB( thermonuclease family)